MNRKCLKRTVYLLLLFFVLPQAAGAMESAAVTVAELAAENEPGPYGGVSLQETTPFPPAAISPWELMEQVARQQSAQEDRGIFPCPWSAAGRRGLRIYLPV